MTTEPPTPGPRVAAELAKLTPRQREAYEAQVARLRAEWARERLIRAEIRDRHDLDYPRLSLRARIVRKWRSLAKPLSVAALVAVIIVGCAGLIGTCLGVFLALVRAGWRAGASL